MGCVKPKKKGKWSGDMEPKSQTKLQILQLNSGTNQARQTIFHKPPSMQLMRCRLKKIQSCCLVTQLWTQALLRNRVTDNNPKQTVRLQTRYTM